MNCPHCGAKVSEVMRMCPACGSELPQSQEARVCPHCSTQLPGPVSVCPTCGGQVRMARRPTLPLPPPARPAELPEPRDAKPVAKREQDGETDGAGPAPAAEEPAPAPHSDEVRMTPLQPTPMPVYKPEPMPKATVVKPRVEKALRRVPHLLPIVAGIAGLVVVAGVVFAVSTGVFTFPQLARGEQGAAPTEDLAEAWPTVAGTATPTVVRETATPTIPPASPTPTVTQTPSGPTATPEPLVYTVVAGDALLSIAQRYDISVADLKKANNLTSDNIRIGQKLIIPGKAASPAPTATAAPASPTPAATATATRAATTAATPAPSAAATAAGGGGAPMPPAGSTEFAAPALLSPANGAVITGAEDVLLNWTSVGLLGDDTWYVVTIERDDPSLPTPAAGWTRTTAWRIPASFRPAGSAASHRFTWKVTVMRSSEGQTPVAVSPASEVRTFTWQ